MTKSVKKAFIFAAGLGTRMRPLTDDTPKPLIHVSGKALLDYQIELVMDAGIKDIAINCFYLADKVKGHVQKYLEKGVNIKIFEEEERLETGGGLVNAKSFINDEPIFTLNSDVIITYRGENPLKKMMRMYNQDKHDILMLLVDKKNAIGFYENGNFGMSDEGLLNYDSQKFIFSGIEIINTKILNNYSGKKIFSLSEVFRDASNNKRLAGFEHEDKWLHVGCLRGLKDAEDFLNQ